MLSIRRSRQQITHRHCRRWLMNRRKNSASWGSFQTTLSRASIPAATDILKETFLFTSLPRDLQSNTKDFRKLESFVTVSFLLSRPSSTSEHFFLSYLPPSRPRRSVPAAAQPMLQIHLRKSHPVIGSVHHSSYSFPWLILRHVSLRLRPRRFYCLLPVPVHPLARGSKTFPVIRRN